MAKQPTFLDRLKGIFLGSQKQSEFMQANQYDVVNRWAQTDQWDYANNRSGNSNDDRQTREKIVAASRFEFSNNSYCRGILLKMAQETIGTGCRLEIMPKSPSARANKAAKQLESIWEEWSHETNFTEKLQMGIVEEIVGGEVFHQFRQNRALKTVPVDFVSYEGIQFQSNMIQKAFSLYRSTPIVDGLKLDEQGNVTAFYKLRKNPGEDGYIGIDDTVTIPSDIMVHMFRQDRPTQYRGVGQLAPCIELFGKLRRFTEATIETAENAASILGTIETAFQPDVCTPGSDSPINIPFGSGNLMTLPDGWKYNAYKPEQPTTGYGDYKAEILHEIISCILMPWNVASADSSDFNFASGQLDHRIFHRYILFMRKRQEERFINRFFKFWLEIATFVPGVIPSGLGAFEHKWYWPGKEPIDPGKMANAAKILKEAGLLNETKYWQEQGISAKDAIDQQIRLEAYKQIRTEEIYKDLGVVQKQPQPEPKVNEDDENVTQAQS